MFRNALRLRAMSEVEKLPSLFLGSSSEGLEIASALQDEISGFCDVDRWDQGALPPSGNPLFSLIENANTYDFAVLVATPDDSTISRGEKVESVRDNIVFEFGLFAGLLGLERTYLLATSSAKLPSDLLGLTRLAYRENANGNVRASVNQAANQIRKQIKTLGRRDPSAVRSPRPSSPDGLDKEIALLIANAESQGWKVKTNNEVNLRLMSPRGTKHVLSKTKPQQTREALRDFASELKADGLRVNRALTRSSDKSPY